MTTYATIRMPQPSQIGAILDLTRSHEGTPIKRLQAMREHTIYTVALGTGLRSFELAALTIGAVFDAQGRARATADLTVYKGAERANHKPVTITIPRPTRETLEAFYRAKHAANEPLSPDAPLFLSQKGNAISTRQMRRAYAQWKELAEIDGGGGIHGLRHAACTGVLRASGKDLAVVQRFARHKRRSTSEIYTHADNETIERGIEGNAAQWSARARAAHKR